MKKPFLARVFAWFPPLVLIALLFVLTKCGKDGPAPGTFGSVYAVMGRTCVQCHKASGTAAPSATIKFDPTTAALAYQTLVTDGNGVGGLGSGAACRNPVPVKYVVPTSPTTSYVAGVLVAGATYQGNNNFGNPGCRPYNHTEDTGLNDADKANILDWINKGAKND